MMGSFHPLTGGLLLLLLTTATVQGVVLRVISKQNQDGETQTFNPDDTSNSQHQLRMLAANFSGPAHLLPLQNTCYSLRENRYQYRVCLYSNVTQQDLSAEYLQQYSAPPVVLGVWGGWVVRGGQFAAMQYTEGSPCSGSSSQAHRSVEVSLDCGASTTLTSVTEPAKCRYLAHLSTPLVCGDSSVMAVYPRLAMRHRTLWDGLYTDLKRGIITRKGYDNRLAELYVSARVVLGDAQREQLMIVTRTDCDEKISALESKVKLLQSELLALQPP